MIRPFLRRLAYQFRRDTIDAELREEIESHRLLREERLRQSGAFDAAHQSRRTLGNITLAQEDARAVWFAWWAQDLLQDARFAVRFLRRQPVFTTTAVLTLAIGTAALAVVFSIANTVLFRPVPYTNADRLVQVVRTAPGQGGRVRILDEVSSQSIDTLRAAATSLEAVTIAYGFSAALSGSGLPEPAQGIHTDADVFRVLGTAPIAGRWPTGADSTAADPWVVISQKLWRSQFDGRDDLIGRQLRINGRVHVVLAVMPDTFTFPAPYYPGADLWVPRDGTHPSLRDPKTPVLLAFGVLRPGATILAADAEATTMASLSVTPWAADIRAGSRPRVALMLGAGLVVFLIVCANVTNMLLSRGVDRVQELTSRVALGAGRWRLMRQMLTETTILFAAGGMCGGLLAIWCLQGLAAMTVYGLPRLTEVSIDWSVLAITMFAVWLAALIVGTLTVLQGARRRVEGSRGASHTPRVRRVQRALMATEVALALVLLLGAGLLADVARSQARIDPGFDPAHLVQARVSLPFDRYPTEDSQAAFTTQVLTRLSSTPGISAAAAVTSPPGSGGTPRPSFVLDGATVPDSPRDFNRALTRVISDTYFATLGLAPVRGTTFHGSNRSTPPVAIVNAAFVRQFLSDVPPVGARIRVAPAGVNALEDNARTIIGVVPDIREGQLYEPPPPTIYLPAAQATSLRMTYLVRGVPGLDAAGEIRAAVADVDPNQALRGPVVPLVDAMYESMTLNRLNLALLGVLASVAVLLSVVGVYGVTAHNVRHRTREIAIRLALGVEPNAVRRLVIADGLRVTLVGLAAGGFGAVWAVPALRSLVIGTSTLSPAVCIGAAVLVLAVVALACDIPARRAAALDPTIVLRGE